MSIYQRGKTWWIQFTNPSGERIQRTAGTQNKREAQELHDKLKAEAWRVKALGTKPRHSWQEVKTRWLNEQKHRKRLSDDLSYLKWLDNYLHDKHLDEINKTLIEHIKTEKLNTGASNQTVNHVLSFLRAILNRAMNDWEWLDTTPHFKMLPIDNERVRFLTPLEVKNLLHELPEHLNAMARFALATGLRESNLVGLKWEQIDLDNKHAWINASESKSGKAIALPLNSDAIAILREREKMRSIIGIHIKHVFTYKGKPVTRANNHAWRKAVKRAGITDFRWHDLRHCWASNHIMNGTPLNVLKELGGWHDLTMVLRYAHLTSKHLAQYAENVTDLRHSKSK